MATPAERGDKLRGRKRWGFPTKIDADFYAYQKTPGVLRSLMQPVDVNHCIFSHSGPHKAESSDTLNFVTLLRMVRKRGGDAEVKKYLFEKLTGNGFSGIAGKKYTALALRWLLQMQLSRLEMIVLERYVALRRYHNPYHQSAKDREAKRWNVKTQSSA